MANNVLNYIVQSLPVIVLIVAWAIRLEIKLAQIQTNIKWLMKNGV